MKLVIGLGNPEEKYVNTRHNVGYLVVDALKEKKLPSSFVVLKSGRYMNQSGSPVREFVKKYKTSLENLYILHDDLDIRLGEYKIQFGKSPKVHNGLKSIDSELGTNEYWHVRIGIDNRPQEGELRTRGEEYVLQDFSKEEGEIRDETIKKIVGDLVKIASK